MRMVGRGVPLTCRDALKEAIWRAMFWRRDHPVLRIRDFSQPGPRSIMSPPELPRRIGKTP